MSRKVKQHKINKLLLLVKILNVPILMKKIFKNFHNFLRSFTFQSILIYKDLKEKYLKFLPIFFPEIIE